MDLNQKIEEYVKLYDLPVEELIAISSKITTENFKNQVEFCSIISAKTGKCQENCKYCSQSGHYKTKIEVHPLITVEEVKTAALSAKDNGATRFCVVTSGKNPEDNDFPSLLKMVETVANIEGIHSCCSLGILDDKQAKSLKEAGAERYNHNLNTAKSYHSEICDTHTFEDRINTIKLIQSHGIEACTGGIIGMGETRRQRIELALELAELNPVSVPVNFLHPVAGTPMANLENTITEEEILKTLAIFRIILPKALIRYAGGRSTRFSKTYQELGIRAGVNALLVGNYLTTTGITPQEDIELVEKAGMTVSNV
ncbi:MAG: biotin synthase BioB [bacterium]